MMRQGWGEHRSRLELAEMYFFFSGETTMWSGHLSPSRPVPLEHVTVPGDRAEVVLVFVAAGNRVPVRCRRSVCRRAVCELARDGVGIFVSVGSASL